MIRQIIQKPDPRLLLPSVAVKTTTVIDSLFSDLIDTRIQVDGVGLAAPQIGVHLRVIALSPRFFFGFKIIVNPEIVERSERKEKASEGCCSIEHGAPKFLVERNAVIRVKFLDRHGDEHCLTSSGMSARIIQHEIDHLEGKLIA